MSKDLLRVQSNERVDIQDFQYLAETQAEAHSREIMSEFALGPAGDQKWVLSGFEMTNPSASELRVTRGRAILARRVGGQVVYGAIVSEGDATKTVDLNTYSPGTYGIYIKFEYVEGDIESRIFWNPAGAGSEYAQSVATRYLANWSVRVESSDPGAEWLKIGEVAQATMSITDLRPLFFEGTVNTYESGWSSDGGGGTNDRNSDRGQYGVQSLQEFTAAMRQCLTDIRGRGLREWYERDIGGMNVGFDADPTEDMIGIGDANHSLALDSSNPKWTVDSADYMRFFRSGGRFDWHISGADELYLTNASLSPAADGGLDLGEGGSAWANLRLKTKLIPDADATPSIGDWSESTHSGNRFSEIAAVREWLIGDTTAGVARLYLGDTRADADEKYWAWESDGSTATAYLKLLAMSDDLASSNAVMTIPRPTGTALNPIQWGASLAPDTTDAMDLGENSTPLRWRDIHLSNSVDIVGGDVAIWLQDTSAGDVDLETFRIMSSGGTFSIYATDQARTALDPALLIVKDVGDWRVNYLEMGGDVLPETVGAHDLGSSAANRQWQELFVDKITLGVAAGEGFQTDVLPTGTGKDLGSDGYRWAELYLGAAAPFISLYETSATSNEEAWRLIADGDQFKLEARDTNDANPVDALTIDRTGTAVNYTRFSIPQDGQGLQIYNPTDATLTRNLWRLQTDSVTNGNLQIIADGTSGGSNDAALILIRSGADFDYLDVKGDLEADGEVRVGGDSGGKASNITMTNAKATGVSGAGSIANSGTGGSSNAGWLKFYDGTTDIYVPYWSNGILT